VKVRELIERLQTMEQDATVTVRITAMIVSKGHPRPFDSEVRIDGVQQHGAGFKATVRLDPEDELKLA